MSLDQILISAGEASGDMHAARLATVLRQRTGAHLYGFGGERMRDAGVELVANYEEIPVMGLAEVVRHIPTALGIIQRLSRASAQRRPALAILVDSPGMNLPLAKKLKRLGIRSVYFIVPQVWAWRPWRIRVMRRTVERALVIFPFEERYFTERGVPATFVGHPLVQTARAGMTRQEFVAKHGLDAQRPIILLMPGSRTTEVSRHLPVILEAARGLAGDWRAQFILAIARGLGRELLAGYETGGIDIRYIEGETYEAMAAADCGIVSSGTATLEGALLGLPMVVVYKVARSTATVARWMIRTPFFAMVNLILGRRAIPELIQEHFTAGAVEQEVRRLLSSDRERQRVKQDLAEVRKRLGAGGAVERAADVICEMMAGDVAGATGRG